MNTKGLSAIMIFLIVAGIILLGAGLVSGQTTETLTPFRVLFSNSGGFIDTDEEFTFNPSTNTLVLNGTFITEDVISRTINNTVINNTFTATDALLVRSNSTFIGDVLVRNNVSITNDLTVGEDVNITGTLFVSGSSSLIGTTFTNNIINSGDITNVRNMSTGNLSVTRDTVLARNTTAGNLTVSANTLLSRTLINIGITNTGTAIKHERESFTVPAGTTQSRTVAWSGAPFADTSYTAVCQITGNAAGDIDLGAISYRGQLNKLTTSIDLRLANQDVLAAHTVTAECIAFHD